MAIVHLAYFKAKASAVLRYVTTFVVLAGNMHDLVLAAMAKKDPLLGWWQQSETSCTGLVRVEANGNDSHAAELLAQAGMLSEDLEAQQRKMDGLISSKILAEAAAVTSHAAQAEAEGNAARHALALREKTAEYEQLKAEYEACIARLEEDSREKDSKITSLENECRVKDSTIAGLTASVISLQGKVGEKDAALNAALLEKDPMDEALQKALKENTKLEVSIDEHESKFVRQINQKFEAEEELKQLKADYRELVAHKDGLKIELFNSCSAYGKLRAEYEETKSERDNKKQQLSKLTEQLRKTQQSARKAHKQNSRVKASDTSSSSARPSSHSSGAYGASLSAPPAADYGATPDLHVAALAEETGRVGRAADTRSDSRAGQGRGRDRGYGSFNKNQSKKSAGGSREWDFNDRRG